MYGEEECHDSFENCKRKNLEDLSSTTIVIAGTPLIAVNSLLVALVIALALMVYTLTAMNNKQCFGERPQLYVHQLQEQQRNQVVPVQGSNETGGEETRGL